jgi:hypothetical protein
MNRKVAVAALVGGLMHTVSLLRGQEPQPPVSRTPRQPVGQPSAPVIGGETSGLTPEIVEDLRKQVAELTRRVDLMERANANSMSFDKVGNDFVFAPPSGNVLIKAPAGLTIQGSVINVAASGVLTHKGSMINLN